VTLTVLNPATEKSIAELEQAGVEETDAASPARGRRSPRGAPSHRRIAPAEAFGPVAAVIPFEDEADAIRIASDTPYGLSGSMWTRDGGGVLSVNASTSVRVQTPFGGFKQSGFGRELGMHALDGYSEIKSVFMSTEV
jgi:acyl-CoA reductase-like NAD-dependent aldehyde dehydrogenase